MNRGKLVFAQLMQHLPLTTFRRCVTRYRGANAYTSYLNHQIKPRWDDYPSPR
jgi:Domain of unknown function (DUF4372)